MRFLKRAFLSFSICAIMLFISGCVPEKDLRNFPLDFVGSTWRTEGGEMEFTVDEDHHALGKIYTNDGEKKVWFSMSIHGTVDIYPIERFYKDYDDETRYEIDPLETFWIGDFSPEEFKAVVKSTTYFEIEQIFLFHRVNDLDSSANGKQVLSSPESIAAISDSVHLEEHADMSS